MKRSLMGRVYYLSVLWLTCIHYLITRTADAQPNPNPNPEVQALLNFKNQVFDPMKKLITWEDKSSSPCSWSHITCTDNLQNVRNIDLGGLGLNGTLVPEFGNLTYLEHLELFQNSLSGPIPLEFAKLGSLISLDLSSNYLSSHIPDHLPELRNLQIFDLSNNNLDGCAPDFALQNLQNRANYFNISNNPNLCSTLLSTSPPAATNVLSDHENFVKAPPGCDQCPN